MNAVKALQADIDGKRKLFEAADRLQSEKFDKFETIRADRAAEEKATEDAALLVKKAEYDARRTTFDEKRTAYMTNVNGAEAESTKITALTAEIAGMAPGQEKTAK